MRKTKNDKENWCIDIYSEEIKDWMLLGDYSISSDRAGSFIHIIGTAEEKNEILRRARRNRIRYKVYEQRWDRSYDYRKKFMECYLPPYRCRYCNRPLKKYELEVDHIIPVSKAKRSFFAKKILSFQHIYNVNDLRNLVPACRKCNQRKGSKMGVWFIRAKLGKYKMYWVIRMIAIFALLLLFGIFCWQHYPSWAHAFRLFAM